MKLSGNEQIDIDIDAKEVKSDNSKFVNIRILDFYGKKIIKSIYGILRIDTEKEFNYIKKGNILNYVLDELSG